MLPLGPLDLGQHYITSGQYFSVLIEANSRYLYNNNKKKIYNTHVVKH